MHLSVSIPQEIVNRLRAGALDALLSPIHEPVEQALQGVLPARFKRASALLEVIGWQAGEAADEVVIDIVEHAPALYDALSYALEDALRDLRRAERAHGCACVSAGGLRGHAVRIEKEELARSRSDPRMRRFHAEAEELIAELDREAAEHTRRSRGPAGCSRGPAGCSRGPAGRLAALHGRLAGIPRRSVRPRRRSSGCHIA